MMADEKLEQAYRECLNIARQHYENFPTAARLLAKPQRRATAAIYAFARSADDIADEGDADNAKRHAQLDEFSDQLQRIGAGSGQQHGLFYALADTIERYQLPLKPFEKLLTAFRSDIDVKRYVNFTQLLDYCDNSANPVGELVLRLHGYWNEQADWFSNRICTALQLINFIQDLDSDYRQRDRLYIPLDEMRQYGIDEAILAERRQNPELARLIDFQIQRARTILLEGQPLLGHCHGRLRLMLKLTVSSGLRVLQKLQIRDNVYARPTLQVGDLALIAIRSLLFRPGAMAC